MQNKNSTHAFSGTSGVQHWHQRVNVAAVVRHNSVKARVYGMAGRIARARTSPTNQRRKYVIQVWGTITVVHTTAW